MISVTARLLPGQSATCFPFCHLLKFSMAISTIELVELEALCWWP
jgi:hypothetical protein